MDMFRQSTPPFVLAPYHRQRSLWRQRVRQTIFYIVLIFVCILYGFFVAVLPPAFYLWMATPVALLSLIAIWALPDRKYVRTRGLEWLFFAYWIGYIMWPNYLSVALPGLPWISVRRLIILPLTLILLISFSTSKAFRDQVVEVCRHNQLITRFLIGFLIVQTISIGFSTTPAASIMVYINMHLMWTAILFVSIPIFLKPDRFERWVRITCYMAIATAIIGIVEWPQQHVLWRDYIPSFLKVDSESVQRALEGQFNIVGGYRSASTFTLSLMFAEYLAMATPFVLHYLFAVRATRARIIWAICYALILFGLIRAGSRLGMVGFAVAHIMFFIIWAIRRRVKLRQSLLAAAVIYGYPAMAGTFVAIVLGVHRVRRVFLGGGEHQASTNARFDQWSMGWPKVFSRPLFGYGPGRSGETLGYVTPGGMYTVDSYYLSILLDFGFLGFICLFGMVVTAMIQSLRIGLYDESRDGALVGCVGVSLGVFLFIKMVLSQADNHSMLFMLLGAVMVYSYRASVRAKAS